MTILAFGCSVMHASETAFNGNSKTNLPFSYAKLIADHLGVECVNTSFCGNGNEQIFHQALETIPKHENITAVIVGWAADIREVWKANGRLWQFFPGWCSTSPSVTRPCFAVKEKTSTSPQCCADEDSYLEILNSMHDMLFHYKFDVNEYRQKRNHYIESLRAYCKVNNIKLLETCWEYNIPGTINIGKIGTWTTDSSNRHPNKEEHRLFADEIIKHYNL